VWYEADPNARGERVIWLRSIVSRGYEPSADGAVAQ
jgi:hypothetical protein